MIVKKQIKIQEHEIRQAPTGPELQSGARANPGTWSGRLDLVQEAAAGCAHMGETEDGRAAALQMGPNEAKPRGMEPRQSKEGGQATAGMGNAADAH